MPIIEINAHKKIELSTLHLLRDQVASSLGIPQESVWLKIQIFEDDQLLTGSKQRPVVFLNCREIYTDFQLRNAIDAARTALATSLNQEASEVFLAIRKLRDDEVFSPAKPRGREL